MTANQLAIVIAPPIFGLLYDLSNSYSVPRLATAGFLALVALRVWRGRRRLPDRAGEPIAGRAAPKSSNQSR